MYYSADPNYKPFYDHSFDCCKKYQKTVKSYNSKSVNPPSSIRFSFSTPMLNKKIRYVPAFSVQSQQKNTIVLRGPTIDYAEKTCPRVKYRNSETNEKVCGNYAHKTVQRSNSFRMYFDRGDLPIKMEYLCGGDKIGWTVDIEKLDYSLYLPLFFDGLCELDHPYKTYARQGVSDLLLAGGDKIHTVVPQLILPLKNALNTRNLEVMCTTLKIIQQLVLSSDLVGPALVPFYRQLLPIFNAYKIRNLNCGDEIDYSQKNNLNLGDLIDETLQILEIHGGEDAFINIKYMVPTYESCYLN